MRTYYCIGNNIALVLAKLNARCEYLYNTYMYIEYYMVYRSTNIIVLTF